MDQNKTAIERAFDMARSGQFATVTEIKRAVSAEGYNLAQLEGSSLTRQLRGLITSAAADSDQSAS